MILFVCGQLSGAQYIYPIIQKWSFERIFKWNLVAFGASCNFLKQNNIKFIEIKKNSTFEVSKYIELIKPSLIITSASVNIDVEHLFVLEGKKKSIPTVSFIDIWANYKNRFEYKGEFIFPDNVLAIDNRCKEEMIKDGIPGNIIKITGQPYLEYISKNVPPLGQNILLAGQPIKKYFGKSFGYDETDLRRIFLKAINKAKILNVLNTMHPEEVFDKEDEKLNILFQRGKGIVDIKESHTVLGIFSMQMVIGYLWGRKVASIQLNTLKTDPSPLSRWKLIPLLTNVNEIIEFLETTILKINQDESILLLKDRFNELGIKNSIKRFENFLNFYLN